MSFLRWRKSVTRSLGFETKRYSRFRRAVDLVASKRTRPSFVQIGANNGIDFDDLYDSVVQHDMPGLVVEPVPDYFAALEHAYSRYPDVKPVNAAIHPTAKSMTMYRVNPDAVKNRWEHGLASFDREHIIRHGVAPEAVEEIQVPCLSLADLFGMLPDPGNVDVFAVDTEGFDSEVLAMLAETPVRPLIVRFESRHMAPPLIDKWTEFFRSEGYRIWVDHLDGLAVSKSLDMSPLRYILNTGG